MSKFSERLKEALELRNMRPIDLANKTTISKASISQYLKGGYVPKDGRIYLMAQALNVREAWLLGYNVPMERDSDVAHSGNTTKFAVDLGSSIKERMKETGVTVKEIATLTGKTMSEVERLLSGVDREFDKEFIVRLAEILDEEPTVFFSKFYPVDSIGDNMKYIRSIAEARIECVAKYIGISQEEYMLIENGAQQPLFSIIEKFSNFFGIEPWQTICKNYRYLQNDNDTALRLHMHALLSTMTDEQKKILLGYAEFVISQTTK